MFNDNDGDLFGDFGSNDQPYETESNPDSKKYDFSKIQSDQIKELGLDDIDSTSDEEDDLPKSSSNFNQSNLKRKMSSESQNMFDNDYDGDLNDNKIDSSKNLKQFSQNLAQEMTNNNLDFSKNENNLLDSSFNHTINNNNDLCLNEDGGSENSKDRKELSNKAKERMQLEREKSYRKKRIEQQEEDNKKVQVLMANFSEEQLNRYEIYRRSAFPKANVKRIIQTVCGKSVSPDVIIAMSGMAKVFIGEIVEQALDIQQKTNETGPLHPKHIREAFRFYKKSEKRSATYKHKKPSVLL